MGSFSMRSVSCASFLESARLLEMDLLIKLDRILEQARFLTHTDQGSNRFEVKACSPKCVRVGQERIEK